MAADPKITKVEKALSDFVSAQITLKKGEGISAEARQTAATLMYQASENLVKALKEALK